MRKDSVLANLTEEQQADLFDWLTTDTYKAVLKRFAWPLRKGFRVHTRFNCFFRFNNDVTSPKAVRMRCFLPKNIFTLSTLTSTLSTLFFCGGAGTAWPFLPFK